MLKKRIFTNTLINAGGKLMSYVLQLVIITFLIRTFGKETYGIVALALALAANTNLLEAGFGLSVTKYVAEYHAAGRREDLLRIINTNFVVSTVLALSFSCVLLVINELYLERIFTIPPAQVNDARWLIRLLLFFSLTEFWFASIVRVAEGFQQYLLIRTLEIVKWFLRAFFVIALTMSGFGLVGVGAAHLIAGIILLGISYRRVFSQASGLVIGQSYVDRGSFHKLFGFSVYIFIAKIFAFLAYKIDTIIIGIYLPLENIAFYTIAFKTYEFIRFGFSLLSSTLVPVTAELYALQKQEQMNRLFRKATRYTMLIMFPVLIFSYFHVGSVIRIWMGEGYEISVALSKLFVISLFFGATVSAGAEMMIGLDRIRELVPIAGIASVINVVISIVLVREIGAAGVVIGTVIGSLLISLGYLHRTTKIFGISRTDLWRDILFGPLVVLALLILLFVVVRSLVVADGIFVAISAGIFFLLFDKDDQRLFLDPFRTKIRKIIGQ